jgi:hypothetical protein
MSRKIIFCAPGMAVGDHSGAPLSQVAVENYRVLSEFRYSLSMFFILFK